MSAYEYVLSKQIQWGRNNGIELIGSKGKRGRPAYAPKLEQNLYEPLESEVRQSFMKGDGSELLGTPDNPAKMQAVHSSSALAVNIFHYWNKRGLVPEIAYACRLCNKGNIAPQRIVFEEKHPIDVRIFRFAPNIDAVIHNSDSATYKRYAIECKFSEAYTPRRHLGLKPAYIDLSEVWEDIPNIYEFAQSICPDDNKFHHLHPAQLIKHILGLKKKFGIAGFRLLYLWYDVLGEEGAIHRREIESFSEVAKSDGVKFHSLSVQELILRLSNHYWPEHSDYIRYISSRYL